MNSDQFLQEVLGSSICPDGFEKIYKTFQGFQNAALSTLMEFHRVCEKNHVSYQLAFGSLIGAIRDGGQIPWDYDIDVLVPYPEKPKLVEALKRDLDDRYYFYSPETNRKCRHMLMRLAPKEYRTEGLHVDVFYLIGTPNDEETRKDFRQKVKSISQKRYGKFVNLLDEGMGEPRRFLRLLIKEKLPAMTTPLATIEREYEALCQKYPIEDSKYCVMADTWANWREFPTELITETMLISRDYGEIRVPVRYKELLTLLYGDYMRVPPLESRIREVVHNHDRILRFQNYHR